MQLAWLCDSLCLPSVLLNTPIFNPEVKLEVGAHHSYILFSFDIFWLTNKQANKVFPMTGSRHALCKTFFSGVVGESCVLSQLV